MVKGEKGDGYMMVKGTGREERDTCDGEGEKGDRCMMVKGIGREERDM